MYALSQKWVLWAHLTQDVDWSIKSYISVMTITYVEELIALIHTLPETLLMNCMFFLMKENIHPTWEDPMNKQGGCFSYKITNMIHETWRDMAYSLVGNVMSKDAIFQKSVTGISISPKKNFCILKVWLNHCQFQDASKIVTLKSTGCIFKRH